MPTLGIMLSMKYFSETGEKVHRNFAIFLKFFGLLYYFKIKRFRKNIIHFKKNMPG